MDQEKIVEITTIEELIEMSTMAGGAVGGYAQKEDEKTIRRESKMISRKDSLESRILNNFLMEHCGHGILPGVRDIYRPVILIDYMFVDSSQLDSIQKTADLFVDYGSASAFIDRLVKR